MAAARASGLSFAATWRDDQGAVVGQSFGGTVCWFPKLPGRLRIAREDFEHVVRCRECPGCLELDRRRLADRLVQKYDALRATAAATLKRTSASREKEHAAPIPRLWLVRIYCDVANHAKLAHRLHRYKRFELEPGFARLGTSSVALLSRAILPLKAWLRSERIAFRIESIKLRRRRRAWRGLTAGLLIARDKYGADLNRYYFSGLPPAERESWEIVRRPYEKGYSRTAAPRAWKGGKLVLIPPEAWRLKRIDRVALRRALRGVSDPDQVKGVAQLASTLASARSVDSLLTAGLGQLPSREQMEGFYQQMRARSRRRREAASIDSSRSLPSEGGAYVSSVHSSEAGPTAEELAARDRQAIERIRERQPGSLTSTFVRLVAHAEERLGKPLPAARAAVKKLRKYLPGGE